MFPTSRKARIQCPIPDCARPECSFHHANGRPFLDRAFHDPRETSWLLPNSILSNCINALDDQTDRNVVASTPPPNEVPEMYRLPSSPGRTRFTFSPEPLSDPDPFDAIAPVSHPHQEQKVTSSSDMGNPGAAAFRVVKEEKTDDPELQVVAQYTPENPAPDAVNRKLDLELAKTRKTIEALQESVRKAEELALLKRQKEELEAQVKALTAFQDRSSPQPHLPLVKEEPDVEPPRRKLKPALPEEDEEMPMRPSPEPLPPTSSSTSRERNYLPKNAYVPTPLVELARKKKLAQEPPIVIKRKDPVEPSKKRVLPPPPPLGHRETARTLALKATRISPDTPRAKKSLLDDVFDDADDAPSPSPSSLLTSRKEPLNPPALKKPRNVALQPAERLQAAYNKASTSGTAKRPEATSSKSLEKGETRKAHFGSSNAATHPRLREPTFARVPLSVRNEYLGLLYKEYNKNRPEAEAKELAETEELRLAKESKTKELYRRQAVNLIGSLRKVAKAQPVAGMTISHAANIAPTNATVGVKAAERAQRKADLEHVDATNLRKRLKPYLLTQEQLEKNCYPVWVDSSKTVAKIADSHWDAAPGREGRDKRFLPDAELQRLCSRCGTRFFLDKHGAVVKAKCRYHSMKMNKRRENKAMVERYLCCDGPTGSVPCCVAESHVSESRRISELEKFREFSAETGPDDPRSSAAYALDCEMVYTTWGPALARVTVVDFDDKVVLDKKILPRNAVVDANTKFSGLTIEELNREGCSWKEANKALDTIINNKTVLIGHSLESDLKAMRIVHRRVVDTSIVYPHKLGPTFKRPLRELVSEHLGKIIQEDVTGHDSKEDASACMQLMLHKIRGK
ncbi:unnamed protein product, partial [Mesorhabditis spiculigera]